MITFELLLLLFIVALFAGWIDTIAGGGGLITIPALLFCGISPASALATNKLQSSMGTFTAARYFVKKGLVNIKSIKLIIFSTFIGSVLGSWLVLQINPQSLKMIIPFLLITISLYTLFSKQMTDKEKTKKMAFITFAFCISSIIGFYDGFFGPGTGSFFTIAYVSLLGFGLTKATAHAKVLNFTSNLSALSYFLIAGDIYWTVGIIMMIGQFFGATMGAKMAVKKGQKLIKPALIVMCLVMSLGLFFQN